MIKGIILKLANGYFEIVDGSKPEVISENAPFLEYTENGIFHAEVSPDIGISYDARIILPCNLRMEFVQISLCEGALAAYGFDTGTFDMDIKNASFSTGLIKTRRMNVSLGNGSAVISAAPLIGGSFECGSGSMTVNLQRNPHGYKFYSSRGEGEVVINSVHTPRNYICQDCGDTEIKLRCGLGRMEINYL